MEKYKPGYLGRVIPINDTGKLTDFMTNKYDAFSKMYDVCKEQSTNIADIKVVESTGFDTLCVKVSCSADTIENIRKTAEHDNTVSITNDVITARSS